MPYKTCFSNISILQMLYTISIYWPSSSLTQDHGFGILSQTRTQVKSMI